MNVRADQMRSRVHLPHPITVQRPLRARLLKCNTSTVLHAMRPCPKSQPPAALDDEDPGFGARARALLVSTLSSYALLLSAFFPTLAAESLTVKFPASRDPEIRSAQEVLVQAWAYVREYYVDPTFNKQDWTKRLEEALAATFRASSRDEALQQVGVLLGSLGDPFTRVLLPGGTSETFQALNQAKIVSTGLLVGRLGGPDGPLQVSFVVEGSPAADAGLREGDEVVAVNGRPVWAFRGADRAQLPDLLRQDVEVRLKLRRATAAGGDGGGAALGRARAAAAAAGALPPANALPTLPVFSGAPALNASGAEQEVIDGVLQASGARAAAATPAASTAVPAASTTGRASAQPPTPSTSYPLSGNFYDVVLRPAPVEFLPVQYTVLEKESLYNRSVQKQQKRDSGGGLAVGSSSDGGAGSPPAPSTFRVGYIRIAVFTEGVAAEVEEAIRALQVEGCGSWLLDLRTNPGGFVREGLQVAELLMPPEQVFAWVTDRDGEEHAERLSERARALVAGQPLAVLVNHYSASTSELLAGALHDDVRALLVGERTYGKGRTQQVVPLSGGATLLVSTDTYLTPARRVVHKVGLAPDVACRPGPPPPPVARPAAQRGGAAAARAGAAATLSDVTYSGAVNPSNGEGGGIDGFSGNNSGADVLPTTGSIGNRIGSSIGSSSSSRSSSGGGSGGGGSMVGDQVDLLTTDECVRAAIGKLTRGIPQAQTRRA